MADVQRQLDRVVSLMRAQQPVPTISTVGLRIARFREGYTRESVAALFDNVAEWQRQLNRQDEVHDVDPAATIAQHGPVAQLLAGLDTTGVRPRPELSLR